MDELENFNRQRLLAYGGTMALIVIVAVIIAFAAGPLFGLAALVIGAGLFTESSIITIEADPAMMGLPKLHGALIDELVPAGWYLVPFRGNLFADLIPITAEEIALRWKIEIRTPKDYAMVEIPFFIYFKVDTESPIPFVVAGNRAGVEQKLKDIIEEILRNWITSPVIGPQTWETARQAAEETLNTVLKALFLDAFNRINRIPTDIPTEKLFQYFSPGRKIEGDDKDLWKQRIENMPNYGAVKAAVERRHEIIAMARNGQINQVSNDFRAAICSLGILITKIGLSNIEPTKETAIGVDEVMRARLTAQATNIGAQQFREEVKAMTEVLGKGHEEAARRAASVRQGKTKEEISEKQISTSPDVIAAVERVLALLIGRKGGTS